MKLRDYEKLKQSNHFEPLWFDLLNASGYAGTLASGQIVDRRYYPDAYPIGRNSIFGVATPKKLKIYIAGKVSGEDMAACTMKFGQAQKEIEKQGFEALNPLEIVGTWHTTWEAAMRKCITAMMEADAVLFLPCWTDSRGAIIENRIAADLNMITLSGTRDLKERLMKQYKLKV